MQIDGLDMRTFRLPLRRPLAVGPSVITDRCGVLLELHSGDHTGFGEIAPLPGLSPETLEVAVAATAAAAKILAGQQVDALAEIDQRLPPNLPPSVRFGLQTAWLHCAAAKQTVRPADLISNQPPPRIQVQGLHDGDLLATQRALADGTLTHYPMVKVKVGRRSAAEDHAVLDALLVGLPAATRLRLDGNRRLTPEFAAELSIQVGSRLDYFEEPLADPSAWPRWHADHGVPMAADEALREPSHAAVCRSAGVTAWILKPTLLGGFTPSLALAAQAQRAGIRCVISSCFESRLGLSALVSLAAAIGPSGVHGLGTDTWFAADLLADGPSSRLGFWDVTSAPTVRRQEGGDPCLGTPHRDPTAVR